MWVILGIPQKVYYGIDTDLHGTRLDVYIEEEDETFCEQATIYDVEPDRNDSAAAVKSLPRRVRFYHAKIDVESLKSGKKYEHLKNVMVIMILSYDPFGRNRMVYTIKNRCVEEPDMEYEDGACTVYLYTKGAEGEPDEALRQLLNYMEVTTEENAKNSDLMELHGMVNTVKRDSEVTVAYMRMMEDEDVLLERGRTEGALVALITLICRKLKKSKTPEVIAEELEEDPDKVNAICQVAEQCAPEYDVNRIYEMLEETM